VNPDLVIFKSYFSTLQEMAIWLKPLEKLVKFLFLKITIDVTLDKEVPTKFWKSFGFIRIPI